MIRIARIRGKSLRLMVLMAAGVLMSMGIFALVPCLLRQTSYPAHFPQASYALLIPVKPTLAPDLMPPEQDLKPLPEEPVPPEPEIEAKPPDIPDMKPPELEPLETPKPEIVRDTLQMPPLEPPTLALADPDPPPLQTPSLQTVSLSALPVQSSPMNLKVNLRVGKAPAPGAMARPAVPKNPAAMQTRFGLNEVDQKPISLAALKPHYPHRARRRGIEGYVTVHFLVDRDGKARELTIVDAKPEGVFDQAVRKTVPRWRFRPGKKAGQPVDTWVEMTIRFELGQDG